MLLKANKQHLCYQCVATTIDHRKQPFQKGEPLDGLKAFNAVGLQNILQAQLAMRCV